MRKGINFSRIMLLITLSCFLLVGCGKDQNTQKVDTIENKNEVASEIDDSREPEEAPTNANNEESDVGKIDEEKAGKASEEVDGKDEEEPMVTGTETAFEAVSNMTVGFNLGNTLDSTGDWISKGNANSYETAWGNPATTPEMIATIKEAGFNAIRVPVTWEYHIDEAGNIADYWLNRVQEVVDYVISQDMYCIINVHHDGGSSSWVRASSSNYAKNGDRFANIWKQIADRFQDYEEKLLFESVNEPLNDAAAWDPMWPDDYMGVTLYNQRFVNTVREAGGYNKMRNLVVMTYAGSHGSKALDNFVVPVDKVQNHIILQVHDYDPVGFTWKEASWTTMRDTWGSEEDYKQVDDTMLALHGYAEQYGVPMIIGEYGVEFKENDEERAKFISYFVGTAAKYGIKCFYWDTGGFALFNRKKVEFDHPIVLDAMVEAAKTTAE